MIGRVNARLERCAYFAFTLKPECADADPSENVLRRDIHTGGLSLCRSIDEKPRPELRLGFYFAAPHHQIKDPGQHWN
jgi:hypothetical protein